MSVLEVLCRVEAAGVALRLDGDTIRIRYPESEQRHALAELISFLRTNRIKVAEVLRSRGCSARSFSFRESNKSGNRRDPYGWQANKVLDVIRRVPAPQGLILWLGDHSPFLYRRLTDELPEEISRAWNDRVSSKYFEYLCFELIFTYKHAVDLRLAAGD